MAKIKKICLLFFVLWWAITSCCLFAAPTASTAKKTKPPVTQKKHVSSKAKKKKPIKKKKVKKSVSHKTSHKKKPSAAINRKRVSSETLLLQKNLYKTLSHTEFERPAGQFMPSLVSSFEQRLVDFVHKTVSNVRYSSYKLGGTRFDASQGIYVVDCSGYVDFTLQEVYPKAYLSLVNSTGVEKPNSMHYYDFFTSLPDDPNKHWNKIDEIENLQPGDILVFRNKAVRRRSAGGHVMVVMNHPVRQGDVYLVSVADSAPSGHSQDTRSPHVSGIGIGTLLLQANPQTGEPAAYSWKVGARWKNNVNFAMARPIEHSEFMLN